MAPQGGYGGGKVRLWWMNDGLGGRLRQRDGIVVFAAEIGFLNGGMINGRKLGEWVIKGCGTHKGNIYRHPKP